MENWKELVIIRGETTKLSDFKMIDYSRPTVLFNRHVETIYPALLRKVDLQEYENERIDTPDNDFLDLYWLKQNSKRVVIISHGLEGNADRAYIKGMAKAFFAQGFDTLAWNYRGCGEEINRQLRFYHSGATDDLGAVIDFAATRYESIYLVGFSLGGNLTLKYLGENNAKINLKIKKAVTFSVPMDLHSSCVQISKTSNWIYSNRFLKSLKKKVKAKAQFFPALKTDKLDNIHTLIDFDDHYTAPIHGFKNAIDYYQRCSSVHFLSHIKTPTLIVNAKNDPFLGKECFPNLSSHSFIKFESPEKGGHVGFAQFNQNGLYWSELRALAFIETND
jgi:uncharacterized protein